MPDEKLTSASNADTDKSQGSLSQVDRKCYKRKESPFRILFWALAFIIMGSLLFVQSQGWLAGDKWFPYFLIGLGAICLADVLFHYLHASSHLFSFWRSVAGIILIFIGTSLLVDYTHWLPLVLIFFGLAIIIRFYLKRRNASILR